MTGHVSTLLLSGVARLFLFLITTARDGVEEQDVRRCTVEVAMVTNEMSAASLATTSTRQRIH
jgi:hypothetical protein